MDRTDARNLCHAEEDQLNHGDEKIVIFSLFFFRSHLPILRVKGIYSYLGQGIVSVPVSPAKLIVPPVDQPKRQTRARLVAVRDERAIDLCEGTIDITAALFNVSSKEMRLPGRSDLGVARVRQIGMYVAHVALGLSMNEVGRGFSRDRTTVLHACHLIEDLREDAEFDRMVTTAERIVVAAFGKPGAAS